MKPSTAMIAAIVAAEAYRDHVTIGGSRKF
jgi:hypothetical protein